MICCLPRRIEGIKLLSSELNAAVHAARLAGEALRSMLGNISEIHYKGPIDLVTEADRRAEALIFDSLHSAFPHYGFMGEEGSQASNPAGVRWIVDPLDGTTNFSHSYPLFCVSIALEAAGEIQVGVVYNPLLDELFTAEKGGGAYLNHRRLGVSSVDRLEQALVASGFPYDVWDTPHSNLPQWAAMVTRVLSPRCDGSAALDLCHLAAGRLDAYWELDLEAWDMAAGALIVSEAGGKLSKIDGSPFDVHGRQMLASNGRLHAAMLDLIRS